MSEGRQLGSACTHTPAALAVDTRHSLVTHVVPCCAMVWVCGCVGVLMCESGSEYNKRRPNRLGLGHKRSGEGEMVCRGSSR